MTEELLNKWESITKSILSYMLSNEIGYDSETAYLLNLTTKENFRIANEYLKENCSNYVSIPEKYIGKIVIMEYIYGGGTKGDWCRIHGDIEEYFKSAKRNLANYLKEFKW